MPAITAPKQGGGTARFTDTSGTTATASDVASGKVFVDSSGATQTGELSFVTYTTGSGTPSSSTGSNGDIYLDSSGGGGGGVTVSPLSVTTNGTYTAPTGEAYSPVTVNVSGGASTTSFTISVTTNVNYYSIQAHQNGQTLNKYTITTTAKAYSIAGTQLYIASSNSVHSPGLNTGSSTGATQRSRSNNSLVLDIVDNAVIVIFDDDVS